MTSPHLSNRPQYTQEDRLILENHRHIAAAMEAVFGGACKVVLYSLEEQGAKILYGHDAPGAEDRGSDEISKILKNCEAGGGRTEVRFSKSPSGRTLRTCAVAIKNLQGQNIGLMCISLDLSVPFYDLMKAWLPPVKGLPEKESLDAAGEELIAGKTAAVKEQIYSDDSIPPRQKARKIVKALKEQGIFKLREAVPEVAKSLGLSKDAVYLHLRQLKKEEQRRR